MPLLQFKSPLSWPESVPVTPRNYQRSDHGFSPQMSLSESIGYLDGELQELQTTNATLSMDVESPTVDRLRKKVGSRTGVCLRFKYMGKPYVLTCDRWQMVEHNTYALHLAFRQWHNVERWGLGSMAMLLAGFAANRGGMEEEVSEASLEPCMEALGLGPSATLEDAIAVYHRRAKIVGRDPEALTKLNILMDEVREYFAGKLP